MIFSIKSLTSIKRGDEQRATTYIKVLDHLRNNMNNISAAKAFLETKLQVFTIKKVAIFQADTVFKKFRDNTAEGDGTVIVQLGCITQAILD